MSWMGRVDDGYMDGQIPVTRTGRVAPCWREDMNAHASATKPIIRRGSRRRSRNPARIVSIAALALTACGTAYEAVALRPPARAYHQTSDIRVATRPGAFPGSHRAYEPAIGGPSYVMRVWSSHSPCVGPPACG
jgi:hypothetical protein